MSEAPVPVQAAPGSTAGLTAFEPADPPRHGHLVLPGGTERALVVAPPGDTVREVSVRRVSVGEVLPELLSAGEDAGPAERFWGGAARLALHLVARGRLLPGVSPGGFDAWRVGPLDVDDAARLRAMAAAMPAAARALPVQGCEPPVLPAAMPLLRAFLDAVADTLPRSPAAAAAVGSATFAAAAPLPPPLPDPARPTDPDLPAAPGLPPDALALLVADAALRARELLAHRAPPPRPPRGPTWCAGGPPTRPPRRA